MKPWCRSIALGIVLALLCGWNALALATTQGTFRLLPDRGLVERIALLEAGARLAGSPQPAGQTPAADLALSRLVFQSERDGNWEIYAARADGSEEVRLTQNSGSDVQPRFNRGCDRVAFTSDRSGNFEIYTMAADGSDLTQLTANSADDSRPAWSPDGARIAFQSGDGAEAELCVMNADGTGLNCLTSNGTYDGQPAWSPDGARIAFVSDRTGGERIWAMDEDGSGQAQLSTLAQSANPTWSPDGARIAFDSDQDGDGWQEMWLMMADGASPYLLYDAGQAQTSIWAGSWSPDAQQVAFTRVSFVLDHGQWRWTSAYLEEYNLVTLQAVRVSSQGSDWSPDWQSTDALAPRCMLADLPAYSGDPISVSWSGQDGGGSGIRAYDVQTRDLATGAWTGWLTGTVATAETFGGVPGHTYQFRCRAIDQMYNVGSWWGQAQTAFYTWALTGTVHDTRGAPVEQVGLSLAPEAFEVLPSDGDGHYAAYVAEASAAYEATWAKAGYGVLPPARFDPTPVQGFEVLMPPADDVIQDGGFESGAFTSGFWIPGGVELPGYVRNSHTGQAAMALGWGLQPGDLCVEPAASALGYGCPHTSIQAAVDAAGYGQTIWVYPGVYTETVVLTSGIQLRSMEGPAKTIIDPNFAGTGVSIWSVNNVLVEGFTIQRGYEYYTGGGIYVRDTDSSVIIRGNRLVSNQGALGAAMILSYTSAQVLGNWFIDNSTSGASPPQANCIAGSHGSPVIANNVFWNNRPGESCVSFYYQTGGSIHNNTFVGNGGGIESARYLDIRNNLIVSSAETGVGTTYECPTLFFYNDVWDNAPNYTPNCPDKTGIDGNVSLDPLFVGAAAGDLRLRPDSPARDAGDPDATFQDPDGSRNDMGAWGGPVALGGADLLVPPPWTHAWLDLKPWAGQSISLTLAVADSSSGTVRSSVQQGVTLTGSLVDPTLAFLYQVRQEMTPAEEKLVVLVSSGGETTELLVESFQRHTRVYVDEVSLGSSYPDLWVAQSGRPASALPGEQVVLTLAYGNRGGADAGGVMLSEWLPPELVLVAANPVPIFDPLSGSWQWSVGDVPGGSGSFQIVVTATVASTATLWSELVSAASIETGETELEMTNNHSDAVIFVGRRTWVPLTFRRW